MRSGAKARKRKADEINEEVGIVFKWVPGFAFPRTSIWEKYNSDAKMIRVDQEIFTDDTSVVGRRKKLEN